MVPLGLPSGTSARNVGPPLRSHSSVERRRQCYNSLKALPADAILDPPVDRVTAPPAVRGRRGGKSELHRARVLGNPQEGRPYG